MVYREAEDLRTLRAKTREAVALAMESRWAEAVAVNREILECTPDDLDACNRLGKALLELGDFVAAKTAFERSLAIDQTNGIARKNVERLSSGKAASSSGGSTLSHKLFTGDSGKSAQVSLTDCASYADRPYLAPGASIELRPDKGDVMIFSCDGEFIGMVPPKLGRRLACMMAAGNRYDGAIASSSEDVVNVVLRECYQHPSQRSKVSFPAAAISVPEEELSASTLVAEPDEQPTTAADLEYVYVDEDEGDLLAEDADVVADELFDEDIPDDELAEDDDLAEDEEEDEDSDIDETVEEER